LSSFAGLAAQVGITLPSQPSFQSPAFYSALLRSEPVLRAAVENRYSVDLRLDSLSSSQAEKVEGTLVQIYDVSGDRDGERIVAAMEQLADDMTIDIDAATGLVTISVAAEHPALAQAVGTFLLRYVDEFNRRTRQVQATTEASFLDDRITAAKSDLVASEDAVTAFLQKNREFRGDPLLAAQYERLSRDLSMRQQLYTNLVGTHDQVRLEALRNTPSLIVVQQPSWPLTSDKRDVVFKIVAGLLLGLATGIAAVVLAAYRDRLRGDFPTKIRELELAYSEAVEGLAKFSPRRRLTAPRE
jgi:uncharacterized protein involved in exopolysaccharide biosynthesis